MYKKNALIRKIRLISKFRRHNLLSKQLQYTYCPISQEVKTIQTMKFGQLIEYNMRNIFIEKSYTKCGGETISRPFPKKSKLSISLDKWS